MSELQNPETNHADEALLLAGYLKPKDLAKELDVSERTIARWHHFREGPPRVEIGRKVYYRKESVKAWIASCEHPEPRAGCARRRPRPRTADSSRLAVPAERNDVRLLPGWGGGND
ncbi:MAG TPA: helix-turn-helix domain-containing protein [Candidatus Binataceae bacterium]|nr:helix-turn-helix domain-containing protein [Candidatus Binataceae bacterium]